LIEKDFHDSGGHCNLALAKGKWSNTLWGWAVPKKSPYTEALNIGYILKEFIYILYMAIIND
jgi:hypothetical protein